MKIWRRIYKDYGYSVVEANNDDFIFETYNGREIVDTQGVHHKVMSSLVENDELVIVIE